MEQKYNVSAVQFFIAMFVSRVVATIALNARFTGGESMLDNTVSCLISMALGFLVALPIWALQGRYPEKSVGEAALAVFGKGGRLVPLCYLLYFILVNGASLALFEIFLLDTVNPDFSAFFVVAALLAVGAYAAVRGLETAARAAVCVFVILLAGCILVFGIVASRFDPENLEPLFYNGFSQTIRGTVLFLARTSIFADMAVLLPRVRGKKKRGFACWAGGVALFVCLLLVLLVGCLGRYAYTQNFPVYTLASITEVRSLQRLDAVFIGIWMMGLIVKLGFDLYACRVCFSDLTGNRSPKPAVILPAVLILILAQCAVSFRGVQGLLLNTWFQLFCTLFTGLFLPLAVWAVHGKGKNT